MTHLSRELVTGAYQLTEAVLQRDLLAAAGVIVYGGAATDEDEITGEGATPSVVSFDNLSRLDQILTDNRTPKHTTVITGSRLVDTKTLPACRIAYIGSELVPAVKRLKDPFNNPAFIPVQQYGDAGTILNGEIGTVDAFRIVSVPEMLHWAGAGADATDNDGFRTTVVGGDERYDVFPILVIGDDAFNTIGFQTDGKTVKFSVLTKMPGRETADRNEPFGETGFSSIKWYYGFLANRPERIAVYKVVAPI
jgi:N4-gp56 family major capsid protein